MCDRRVVARGNVAGDVGLTPVSRVCVPAAYVLDIKHTNFILPHNDSCLTT